MRAVNLVPADQRSGHGFNPGHSGGLAYVVVGALGAALLCTYVYVDSSHQLSAADRDTAQLQQAASAQASAAASYTSYQSALQTVRERVSAVDSLASARFDWAGTMRELARVIPRTVQVSNLSLSVRPGLGGGASSQLGSALDQPTVVINGCALNTATVADLISRLQAMRRVTDVSLDNTVASDTGSGGADGSCTVAKKYRTFVLSVHYQTGTSRPASDATTTSGSTASTTSATTGATTGSDATATTPSAVPAATPAATAGTPVTTTPDAQGATTP